MTGSISDTEYPDGIDLGGFKQTTSPADGRFREGKGLTGFRNPGAVSPPGQGAEFMAELPRIKTLITHTTIRGKAAMG